MNEYPILDIKRSGARIHGICKYRKISPARLQERLGLGSIQAVYNWFNGKTMPSVDNLYAMSRIFNVPVDALLIGEGETEDRKWLDLTARMKEYKRYLETMEAA